MNYWLLKTEPETFGIADLEKSPHCITPWEGVRNYQARNFLRDQIKKGDLAFFYHSSCKEPGIIGIVEVVSESYPDTSALDPSSDYYDPKSTQENPRWYVVDVQLINKFKHIIKLTELRKLEPLKNMVLLQRGNRLSITPVSRDEWNYILTLVTI